MRKYIYIFKSEVMSNLQYVFNVMAGFIGYFLMIFVFINLWQYIYSDPSEVINGYTMNQMIWYVIITEILWGVVAGRKLCKKICADVKGGNIAYNINKPYNYVGYSLANHLGDAFVRAVMYIILGMLVGWIFLGSFPNLNIISIVMVLISGVLATVISTLLIVFIGLFSFIIEDANPFYWLYSKLILVVGTLFPIEYFPKVIQPILAYSPVYAVCYGPAKLFVDFSWSTCLNVLGMQIVYVVMAWLMCMLLYKKGVRNLNVNGG